AREDATRLLIGVLGEVAQHEDDLVLHVEGGVAVVPESLTLGDDDAIAGENDGPFDIAVVRERQSAHGRATARGGTGACMTDVDGRSAVARAGCEVKRQEKILLPGQRLRADLLELGDEKLGRQMFAVRSSETALHARRRQRLND